MTDELLAKAQTALSGMKSISVFCRSINLSSSESSIINMIQACDFPARKIGGIWESDKAMIIEWRRRFINGEVEEKPNITPPQRHSREGGNPVGRAPRARRNK